jgi:hypothetical protein
LRFVLTQIGGELLVDAYELFSRRPPPRSSEDTPRARGNFGVQNVTTNVSIKAQAVDGASSSRRQEWFLSQLMTGKDVAALDIVAQWHVNLRTARRDISELKKSKEICFIGGRRRGGYHLIDDH